LDHKLWWVLTTVGLYLLSKLIFLQVKLHKLLWRGLLKAAVTRAFLRVLFNYSL